MKTQIKILAIVLFFVSASCSSQKQLSNRLNGEWEIEQYEVHQPNGVETRLGNIGSIVFNSDGTGSQSFTSAITQVGGDIPGDFVWTNTAETVYITGENMQTRKAWIILESKPKFQHWRSTDNQGNLQIMHLNKKEEDE